MSLPLREAVDDFLGRQHLAVAGVSRNSTEAANLIYRKLRDAGYHVSAINPNAERVEGDPCYPHLQALPEPPEGVVIATAPAVTMEVVKDCVEQGVKRVWMHRSFGAGSVSEEAVAYGRAQGLTVIDGGCPMMFCEPVDVGHKCIRWVAKVTGKMPTAV